MNVNLYGDMCYISKGIYVLFLGAMYSKVYDIYIYVNMYITCMYKPTAEV